MIDEAFLSFQHIIERMLSMDSEFIDHELGIRSYIYAYEIETPLELDIVRDADGQLQIGSAPPLYYLDTSIRPSFHRLRFTAQLAEVPDGE